MSKSTRQTTTWVFLVAFSTAIASCAEPLSKREQGGLAGAGLGAASGAIIGSTVGPAGAGALVGDQLMAQDQRQERQQRAIDENQAELARLRREVERLRRENERPEGAVMKNPIIQDEKAVAPRRQIINTTFGDLVVAVTDEVKPYIGDPSCRYAVVSQILSDLLTRGVAHVSEPVAGRH